MMKLKLATLLAVATVGTTAAVISQTLPASAAALTWNLNATFADGGTAKGTFDYDATSGILSDFSIKTSNWSTTTPSFPAFTYTASNSTANLQNTGTRYLSLSYQDPATLSARSFLGLLAGPLTNAGGSISLLPANLGLSSREEVTFPTGTGFFRNLSSGTVSASTTAVPTPALLPGLVGLGLSVVRRQRKAKADKALV